METRYECKTLSVTDKPGHSPAKDHEGPITKRKGPIHQKQLLVLMLSDLAHTQTASKPRTPSKDTQKAPTVKFYAIAPYYSTFTLPKAIEHMRKSKQSCMFHAGLHKEKRWAPERAGSTVNNMRTDHSAAPHPPCN